MRFGSSPSVDPWPLDVLTLDYLVSGQVEPPAQKWGWTYFSTVGERGARELEVTVADVRATGRAPEPAWPAGTRASFAFGTALVALVARGPATVEVWQRWAAAAGQPVAAELLVGPYALAGQVLSPDGTLSVLLNDRIAVQDATITRVDGAGDDTPIDLPQGIVSTAFVHGGALSAPAG